MSEALVPLAKFEGEASALGTFLADLVVDDDDSFQIAASILVDIKTTLKEIETEREKIAGPQYKAFKATNALFSKVSEKYVAAETRIKALLGAYTDARRAEERRLLEAASEAETHSLTFVAEAAPVAPLVSTKTVKDWRLVDASLVPDEFWVLDEKLIAKAVKASVNIPGVEVFTRTVVAAGTR